MNITYLSLGTNLGNKIDNLKSAISKIKELGSVLKISSVYQTPPWGFISDDFYNIALILKTPYTSENLIKKLLDFETDLGRIRNKNNIGYTTRPIDIDIIFFNNEIINTKYLTVPHPRMHERKFVLIPTIEIVTNYNHPVFNKTIETLLNECEDESEIALTTHSLFF